MALFNLLSKYSNSVGEIPHDVYPRPMMKRDSYFTLNGKWEFGVGEKENYDKEILVPFPPESLLSGIGEVFGENLTRFYRKKFTLPENFNRGRVLLHFGAVDQIAKVYLNGKHVASHTGGYIPFSIDITDFLQEENLLCVHVNDYLSNFILPYGKQCAKRGGMWYTPISGIWQSVWIESVPNEYIESIKTTTQGARVKIKVQGVQEGVITLLSSQREIPFENGEVEFEVDSPIFWTPDNPHLYQFTVKTKEDEVLSYFALRDISVKRVNGVMRICLNDKPIFMNGLLDQGYWSDGIFLPASPLAYTEEIKKVKALGFNVLRKHIKIEPQIFYSECDRLGIIVWQDMINNGKYKFLRDTVFPTVGFLKKNDKRKHKNKEQREAFISTMKETVNLLYNHPSVCYWTIFNEGWGQFDSQKAYETLKELDTTRIIDTTSGWFKCGDSDVLSRHIYFRKIKIKPDKKPVVLSEFGGATLKIEGHIFNPDNAYGYSKCNSREEFVQKFRDLYLGQILPAVKRGLCASIFTQVSDVEDEINGLFTYDRKVDKIYPNEFIDVSQKLQEEIQK